MNENNIAFLKAVLFTACVVYGISIPFTIITSDGEFATLMTVCFLVGTAFAYIFWRDFL